MRKKSAFLFTCLLTLAMTSGLNAQWEHLNNLGGAHVNALTEKGTYLFAGTGDNGVFRSGDNGVSWLQVNTGLTTLDIKSISVRGTYLFAGTYGGGVFRSSDNGAGWQAMNTGISTLNIQALGGNDSFLFAGTSGGGVCRSADSGAHWLEVSNGLVHINIFSIGVTSRYVFAGTWGSSAFRTEDNGLNWYLVTNGLYDPSENKIPYCFATADTFLFTGTGGGGIFRAKDSARAWYPFNTGLPDTAFVTALTRIEDTLFAATHNGVYRTINNGSEANWVPDNNGLADTIVLSLIMSGGSLFAGTDGYGVWRRSHLAIPIPQSPVLSSPGNGASGSATSPALSWNSVTGAATYTVQVSTAADFATLVVNQNGIGATSYNASGLLNSTAYYWRVNASNAGGTGAWSAAWSFTTIIASPAIPVAISPDSGALDVSAVPTFSWHSGQNASLYHFQLSTDASFIPLLLDSGNIHDTLLLLTSLQNSTMYFWRVSSINAATQSPWSTGKFFTTICGLPPPVALLPYGNDTLKMDSILCKWGVAAPHVMNYHLQVFSDSALRALTISDSAISDTSFMIRSLHNDQTFWWRVRARNTAGYGPFSNVERIIVHIPTTAVIPHSATIAAGSSFKNGNFHYGIPKSCAVSLVVYDILGRSLWNYASSNQLPGYYIINLNRVLRAPGRYFMRFAPGDYQRIIPFIIN